MGQLISIEKNMQNLKSTKSLEPCEGRVMYDFSKAKSRSDAEKKAKQRTTNLSGKSFLFDSKKLIYEILIHIRTTERYMTDSEIVLSYDSYLKNFAKKYDLMAVRLMVDK